MLVGVEEYGCIIIDYAYLSFKQHVFLQASRMMKSLTYVRFSSESWKKHKRYFQPDTA